MKKVVLFVLGLLAGSLSVCTAQLKVDSLGRSIFGKDLTYDKGISIVDNNSSTNQHPFRITRSADNLVSFSRSYGKSMVMNTYGEVSFGTSSTTASANNIAVTINTSDAGTAGLFLNMPGAFSSDGVKVKYTESSTHPFAAYYNNNPVFYVNGNGVAYTNGTPITSDASLKRNIELISNPLDKVMQLRGVSFDLNFPDQTDTKTLDAEKEFEYAKMRTPELTRATFDQIQKEKSRKRIGVIAQEVEAVLPELVRTREDGLKAVFYSEMVGLLIEAIKEQQNEIDELKLEIAASKSNVSDIARSAAANNGTTGISDITAQCTLTQNIPNPFTNQTEIKYYVANGVKEAFICVFDMQGKMLQKLDVIAGQNSVIIQGSALQPGMYLYSLVADGKEVDTKRMILTK